MTAPRGRTGGPILTWADRLVLYVIVGLGLLLLLVPHAGGGPRVVLVEGPAGFRAAVPLNEEMTFEVEGPIGTTVVVVGGGSARIVSSPCPHGVCVATGAISEPGEAAVCVPNGVVVRIASESGPDATTR